jgi:hypothetical protein
MALKFHFEYSGLSVRVKKPLSFEQFCREMEICSVGLGATSINIECEDAIDEDVLTIMNTSWLSRFSSCEKLVISNEKDLVGIVVDNLDGLEFFKKLRKIEFRRCVINAKIMDKTRLKSVTLGTSSMIYLANVLAWGVKKIKLIDGSRGAALFDKCYPEVIERLNSPDLVINHLVETVKIIYIRHISMREAIDGDVVPVPTPVKRIVDCLERLNVQVQQSPITLI